MMTSALTVLLLCVSLTQADYSWYNRGHTNTCNSNYGGQCVKTTGSYCPPGHKRADSGCGWQEVCCYPYVEKQPTYYRGSTQCGVSSLNSGSRVVGGQETSILNYPWTVNIQKSGQPMCGGSLIADNWVLTAAHCVVKNLDHLTVVVGSTKNHLSYYEVNKRHAVSKILRHSQFNMEHASLGYDIAMLKLSRPVSLSSSLQGTICLPQKGEVFENQVCVVSGWGYTHEPLGPAYSSGGSPTLRRGVLPILSKYTCKYYNYRQAPKTICAGYRSGGIDSCQGDSGGPLVCQGKDGVWKQAGIVSVGRGCARKYHMGIYTEVSGFIDWINFVMENY